MFNFFYALKFLKKNIILTILTILCVTGSSLILTASTNIGEYSLAVQKQELTNNFGDYDLSLIADYETDATFASVLKIKELEEYYDEYITAFRSLASLKIVDEEVNVDLMACDTSTLNSLTSAGYKNFGYGDIVISKSLANKYNLSVNDKFIISHFGFERSVYISNIVDNSNVFSNSELDLVVIDHTTMSDLFPFYNKYVFNFALFKSDNPSLEAMLNESYSMFATTNLNSIEYIQKVADMTQYYTLVILIPCLLICLVISYTIYGYFEKKNDVEFNKLTKIGLENKNVKKIKLIQNIVLSTTSLVIVLLFLCVLLPVVNNVYGIKFTLGVVEILYVATYIYLVPIIIYLIFIIQNKIKRKTLFIFSLMCITILFYLISFWLKQFDIYFLNILSIYLFVFTAPVVLFHVIKMIIKNKKWLINVIIRIEKCFLLPILTIGVLLSFSFNFYISVLNTGNVVLTNDNDITITGIKEGIDYKTMFDGYDATFLYQKSSVKLNDEQLRIMYGIDNIDVINDLFNIDIKNVSSLNSGEVVLSTYYKDVEGLEIGDEVRVNVNNIESSHTISGFVKSGMVASSFMFISNETLGDNYNVNECNKIIIKNCVETSTISSMLKNQGVNARVYNGISSSNAVYLKNLSMFRVISFFIMGIVWIEVLFVLSLRYVDNKKEVNILKMIGCSDRKLIINEIIIFSIKLIISTVISIALVTLLSGVLFEFFKFNDVYIDYKMSFSINWLTAMFCLIVLIECIIFLILHFRKRNIR